MFSLAGGEQVWKDTVGGEGGEVKHSHDVEHWDTYVLLFENFD